jgi:hypothetical protein
MEPMSQSASTPSDLKGRVRAFIAHDGSDTETEETFNRLALDIFAFQWASVPIYGRLCARRGITPESIKSWTEIPALPTSSFKEFAVSSLSQIERTHVFHSSGTTRQTPSRHFHGAESLALYETSLLTWFERSFSSSASHFVFLTPPPSSVPHSSLVHMFETLRRQFGADDSFYGGQLDEDGWNLDFEKLTFSFDQAIAANRPVALLGTAFSFVHLVDHLADGKVRLRLPQGSWVMETGGYKGRSRVVAKTELRRLITRHLGVAGSQIFTEYGMSELSSQAYDGGTGIFRFPPWVRAQIISPETGALAAIGETGLLRIFDLANLYSVSALQTEDLAVRHEDGFELLGRAAASEPRGCSLMATT